MYHELTTIEIAEWRLEQARTFKRRWSGHERNSSVTIEHFDKYVTVSDGQDNWLAETVDYESTMENLIDDILRGQYDRCIPPTAHDPDCELYSDLCHDCECLYSRIGTPSDPSIVRELDCSRKTQAAIAANLGIEVTS